jgi:FkbM family methyltransferase
LSLIPTLESDVVKNRDIIEIVSSLINKLNLYTLGEHSNGMFDLMEAKIIFPFYSFGNVKSYFHMEYREMVIFAIYRRILGRYSRFLDVGGNLGLHSIIAGKVSNCEVMYIEPDSVHFSEAVLRFNLNGMSQRVKTHNVATSNFDGIADFIRVVDNTTGSHLAGVKSNTYGPIETFQVKVSRLNSFIAERGRTLAKIDIEGAEVHALNSLTEEDWGNFDCIVEITDANSAKEILLLAEAYKLSVYSQKISWNIALKVDDLPQRWDQGSVLISKNLTSEKFLG